MKVIPPSLIEWLLYHDVPAPAKPAFSGRPWANQRMADHLLWLSYDNAFETDGSQCVRAQLPKPFPREMAEYLNIGLLAAQAERIREKFQAEFEAAWNALL